MLTTLWNGRQGLLKTQNRLDIISNNISNSETNGYKSLDLSFADVYSEKTKDIVSNTNAGIVKETNKDTDFAILGSGYVKLTDEEGNEFYSRDTSFNIDSKGNFVHSSGLNLVIKDYKPNKFERPVNIDENGKITCNNKANGKIELFDFINRDDLKLASSNLYKYDSEASSVLKATGKLKQGYTEGSNVDTLTSMTDMMMTQRAFALNSKSIQTADQMWQIANNLKNK